MLLNSGVALYNLTVDGQGKGSNYRGNSDSESISDRLAESERWQKDEAFSMKKKDVIDAYDSRLLALLPQSNFWAYFMATFVFTLIVLSILIPKIKDASLIVLSGIVASIVSPFISSYFQEKVKQSAHYQSLVKQRDEQLRVIDNERRKMKDWGCK